MNSSPRIDSSARDKSTSSKVWLLTNWPNPYQLDLMRAIGQRCDVDLSVRFMRNFGEVDQRQLDQETSANFRIMSGLLPRRIRDEFNLHPRAVFECLFSRHDCFVLSGAYTSITFLACALILALRGKPIVLWLERPHPGQPNAPWSSRIARWSLFRWIRERVQRALLRVAKCVLCVGQTAADEYEAVGAPKEKLRVLPYCLDLNRFSATNQADVGHIASEYQLGEKTVFLFSGQLIERKGADTTIEAFTQLAKESTDVSLLMLGDGPLREQLEMAVPTNIRSRVHFLGHREQLELPAIFQAADVFVFPSRHDGWAVVINEACAASLPIITTRQTGAAHELVDDGSSGYVLDCEASEDFYRAMKRFVDEPELTRDFGLRSRELVERFTAENGASLFSESIHEVIGKPRTAAVELAVTAK